MCAGLGVFQDVTMRLIADRIVVQGACGTTYVDRELLSLTLNALPPPSSTYHIYCSEANPGAVELVTEVATERNLKLALSERASRRSSRSASLTGESRQWLRKVLRNVMPEMGSTLAATATLTDLAECDRMLLYLNAQTWTRGAESDALAHEVAKAIDLDVHLLLAHESASSRRSHHGR
jgi:hypothetical protein